MTKGIVTPLDKEWARKQAKKLIRSGKLKRKACAVCGAAKTQAFQPDVHRPERVRWLCVTHHRQAEDERLSALQRTLLKEGLYGYSLRKLRLASGLAKYAGKYAESFRIRDLMHKKYQDKKERASRRAAAGLSLKRLIRRGLLEVCGRGRWRLTAAGLKKAKALHAELGIRLHKPK
jgi:hypothetical protein